MRSRLSFPSRVGVTAGLVAVLLFGCFTVGAASMPAKTRVVDIDGLDVKLIHPPKFGIEESMLWVTPVAERHGGCLGRRQISLFRNGVLVETQTQPPGIGEVFFGVGEPAQPGTYVAQMAKLTISARHSVLICRAAQSTLKITG